MKRIKNHIHSIIALTISLTILFVLYYKIDFSTLPEIMKSVRYVYLALILLITIINYLLISLRWQMMVGGYCKISYLESLSAVISASSLDIIVPSKLGSFAKAYFLKKSKPIETNSTISLVIYEKLLDLSSLSLFFIITTVINRTFNSLIISTLIVALSVLLIFSLLHIVNLFNYYPIKGLRKIKPLNKMIGCLEIIYTFNKNPNLTLTDLVKIYATTLLLWLMNATQIIFIFYLIGLDIPGLIIIMHMFCAIFIGLLPISIAGLGTRDLTIVYLFQGLMSYNQAVLIGGITSIIRYFIPALIGIPVFNLVMFPIKNTHKKGTFE